MSELVLRRLGLRQTESAMAYRTPYVTPHILHKNYAQAFDAEPSKRMSSPPPTTV